MAAKKKKALTPPDFRKQMPKGFATITDIPFSQWEKVMCDLCDRGAVYRHPEGGLRCDHCPRPEP